MYGYIGRIQRGIPYSPPSSPESFAHQGTPDLAGETDSLTSPSSTSSLPAAGADSSVESSTIGGLRKLYNIASRLPSQLPRGPTPASRHHDVLEDDAAASGSQFDSLQDLLERAGYKETRVITPDRQTMARHAAQGQKEDFSAEAPPPSEAAASLRSTIQRACSDERKPRQAARPLRATKSSGWLFSAFWKAESHSVTDPSVPPLPPIPTIRVTASGGLIDDMASVSALVDGNDAASGQRSDASTTKIIATPPVKPDVEPSSLDSPATKTPPTAGEPQASQRIVKKKASQNQLWQGSLAYRTAKKSQTAPVRITAALNLERIADQGTVSAANQLNASRKGKRRTGLVQAFADSPTKSGASGQSATSPERQRQWRKERAAWRESLQGLNSISGQPERSKEPSKTILDVEVEATEPMPCSTQLLAGPAMPFLSMDPAVALRNEACLRPSHLRRMKSVEALSKALRDLDTPAPTARLAPPSPAKPPSPPTLMVSSPSGINSPKVLELNGTEFEPRSWSPMKGEAIITSRCVTKRRSKSRLSSSHRNGATSPMTPDGEPTAGLEAVRGRTKSPRKSQRACPASGSVRGDSRGSSTANKVRAQTTKSNVPGSIASYDASGKQPFTASRAGNATRTSGSGQDDDDDPFRCSGPVPTTIQKKAFMQSLSRGSKIARLIEQTNGRSPSPSARPRMVNDENSLVTAGIDSPTSRISANRRGTAGTAAAGKRISGPQSREAQTDSEGLPRLSSSLSRGSARRMEAITAALREGASFAQAGPHPN